MKVEQVELSTTDQLLIKAKIEELVAAGMPRRDASQMVMQWVWDIHESVIEAPKMRLVK